MNRRTIIPIVILCLLALAEYYTVVVVWSAVRNLSRPWRIGITTAYVLLSLFSWVCIFTLRSSFWHTVPPTFRNFAIAFTIGLSLGKILVLILMLADDVRRLFTWIYQQLPIHNTPKSTVSSEVVHSSSDNTISRSSFIKNVSLILAGTAVGGLLFGITNRYSYRIRRVALNFPSLPDAFKGLKIVQISDIHTGSFDNHEAVAKGIKKALDEQPDIILFTGDLVNNKASEVYGYEDIYSSLKAPMGVYSTLGNHDYGDYVNDWKPGEKQANLEELKNMHASFGWRLLMNEHVILERGSDKIAIVGIENWSAKANFPKHGDMKAAWKGLPEQNIPFKLLLSHDPSHWDAQVIPEYKDIQLTLSGHTHGMQFGVEIPWLKWSPVQYMYKKWAGLYQEGEQYLYVNRGFGFLGYPGRLGIMPEITVIELNNAT